MMFLPKVLARARAKQPLFDFRARPKGVWVAGKTKALEQLEIYQKSWFLVLYSFNYYIKLYSWISAKLRFVSRQMRSIFSASQSWTHYYVLDMWIKNKKQLNPFQGFSNVVFVVTALHTALLIFKPVGLYIIPYLRHFI